MRIGLPKEIKDGEQRVALTPAGVAALARAGHALVFEPGAGAGVGFADRDYADAGAVPGDAWGCELVVKVKELQRAEYAKPRRGQTVFGFQHFAPEPALLDAALASRASFVAFETVGQASGLPILAPMSAIAGRLAVQVGAWCLQKPNGGSGVLLPGLDGVAPGKVVILGAGNVGANALARTTPGEQSDRIRAEVESYPWREIHPNLTVTLSMGLDADLSRGSIEHMLQVAGPLAYPWGPPRPRYPRRAHELNAAAIVLTRGCERMGIPWSQAPIATLSVDGPIPIERLTALAERFAAPVSLVDPSTLNLTPRLELD